MRLLKIGRVKKGKHRTQLPIIFATALHEIHKAFSGKILLSKYGFSLLLKDQEAIEQNVIDSKVKNMVIRSKYIQLHRRKHR